jgi:hypothetical protein
MQTKKLWRAIVTTSMVLALIAPAFAQSQRESFESSLPSDSSLSGTPSMPESEKENRSTIKDEAVTEADHMLNQRIRQVLGQDTALAAAAQSVSITTDNGEVTLHGSVATEKEKADINTKIQQVSGVKKLYNQLQMAPPDLRANKSTSPSESMTSSARSKNGSSSDTVMR